MRLIDADALADRLYKLSSEYPEDETILRIIAGGLRHDRTFAPTIEAEPVKHGRWETANIIGEQLFSCEPFEIDVFVCSVCKAEFDVSQALNYCPNCGAKMDEEDEA